MTLSNRSPTPLQQAHSASSMVAAMREALRAPTLTSGANSRQVLRQRLMVYLLQSSERASVADFLERSAKIEAQDRDRLLEDASAIRAGQMP